MDQPIQEDQIPGNEAMTAGGQSVHSPNSENELQGDIQPPVSLLPAKVNWKKSGKGLKVMDKKPNMDGSVVAKTGGKQRLQEHDFQKLVFTYYFGLGSTRSLGQVAQHFKKKITLIQKWSSCFDWAGRIRILENQSVEETFKTKAISILNLILDSLTKKDRTGKLVLASNERTAVEKLKLSVDSFKHLRQDSREHEEHEKEMNSPGGKTSGKGRGGTLVNVVITR